MKKIDYLILIPNDPKAIPSDEQAEAAADVLEALVPQCDEVSYDMFEDVRFIDAGQDFDEILCPLCSKNAETWWAAAMESAADDDFEDLDVVAKCCSGQTNLNALTYLPAAAFASFTLVATNPRVKTLDQADLAAIGAALGTDVRMVWQKV